MKKNMLLDFTGDKDESRRRGVASALRDDRVTSASMIEPTKTDERDNERFNIQYECSMILRNIRDISR